PSTQHSSVRGLMPGANSLVRSHGHEPGAIGTESDGVNESAMGQKMPPQPVRAGFEKIDVRGLICADEGYGQGFTVRAKRQRREGRKKRRRGICFASRMRVKKFQLGGTRRMKRYRRRCGARAASRGKSRSVRAKVQSQHVRLLRAKCAEQFARGKVPEPDGIVAAGRRQGDAIGTEGNGVDRIAMDQE